MTWYNLTGLGNQSGPMILFQTVDANTGQWFGGAMLMFLFLLLLVSFRQSNNQNAFLAASWITAILAGLAFGFGVIEARILTFPAALVLISIIMKVWGES